ncbi:Zn-dependent protease [Thermosporothrix hazakensis]|jgi:Zn-dependent protease|uniref:Zn-dependent protease n=2 Tax=Thermosporothrix TaxID=768650 RepID=A0A326U116_THEHA|nr:site-2 protease family protein [Thermosporothrix hazakensis]PZW24189.1 Zn-dependent protease [Thermosporothrix hazakensis]BBH89635.1 peptidase M50 [Thermosporothrix sp. COM3]GCE47821.1 peptidase M50 [Thermosporothrix hazakensis]
MMIKLNVILALMLIGSFLVAIALHEWSHAVVASWLGDPTPRSQGRKTLRIPAHIDPLGLLMCLFMAFQTTSYAVALFAGLHPFAGVALGWGKPVRTDPWKLRGGADRGTIMVACAGPLANLIIGIVVALVLRLLTPILDGAGVFQGITVGSIVVTRCLQLLAVFATVNVGLAIFNIIPLPPLDGYKVLYGLLPVQQAKRYANWAERYGMYTVLAIFFLVPFFFGLIGLGAFAWLDKYIVLGAWAILSLISGIDVSALYLY